MVDLLRRRHLVLRPGASVSGENVLAGSIGMIVRPFHVRLPLVLSAWHVLYGPYGHPASLVLQPSAMDGGDARLDAVGHVRRYLVGALGDAALVPVPSDRRVLNRVLLTDVSLRSIRDPKVGDVLHMVGRTSGHRVARVDCTGPVRTRYAHGCPGMRLVPVVGGVADISRPGDSGAVWYEPVTGAAVGLHVEGNVPPHPEVAYALSLGVLSSRLQVAVWRP